MSEDKTYCHYLKCPNKKCEHHASHITQHYVYHEFEFFKDCVWWDLPEVYFAVSKDGGRSMSDLIDRQQLPSAQPERTGHWIVETDCEGKTRTVICEDCGYESGPYQWKNPKFCANCGRRMIEKDGETE